MAWMVKKGTKNIDQFFTIKESDGTVKNISGYTVRINARQGSTSLFSGVLTVASGTTGYAYYTVLSGDLSYSTNADYEIVLEKGNELIPTETYPLQIGRRV